ncbi:hypothetical protein [Candidatus Nitrosocosmicus arcticus]|nr:hypothetical protein [Candidatus Nitrosocosmicus arcticus]
MFLSGMFSQKSLSIEEYHDCPKGAEQELCESTPNISKGIPVVTFPTREEIYEYINSSGGKKEFNALSNASQGFSSNIQTASAGNTTWTAWQGNVDGINKIFAKVSYNESLVFTPAVQLSEQVAGNASKLELDVSENGNLVYAVWQDSNITTGKNRIMVSASMDGGGNFSTYTLNTPNDADSIDPGLNIDGEKVVVSWTQAGPNGTCSPLPGTACNHGRW